MKVKNQQFEVQWRDGGFWKFGKKFDTHVEAKDYAEAHQGRYDGYQIRPVTSTKRK